MRLTLASGELELLPEHAVLEPETRSLLVADLHLGKGLSFRAQGLNVPAGSTARTLERLARLLDRHQPAALVILGDLLHDARARHPAVLEQLAAWRHAYPELEVSLLTGNHDRQAGALPEACGIRAAGTESRLGAWTLRHDPVDDGQGFTIAGHVHPAVRVAAGIDALVRPCFWLRERSLVIPAFGALTGGWRVRPVATERVFISTGAAVLEVTAAAIGSEARGGRALRASGPTSGIQSGCVVDEVPAVRDAPLS